MKIKFKSELQRTIHESVLFLFLTSLYFLLGCSDGTVGPKTGIDVAAGSAGIMVLTPSSVFGDKYSVEILKWHKFNINITITPQLSDTTIYWYISSLPGNTGMAVASVTQQSTTDATGVAYADAQVGGDDLWWSNEYAPGDSFLITAKKGSTTGPITENNAYVWKPLRIEYDCMYGRDVYFNWVEQIFKGVNMLDGKYYPERMTWCQFSSADVQYLKKDQLTITDAHFVDYSDMKRWIIAYRQKPADHILYIAGANVRDDAISIGETVESADFVYPYPSIVYVGRIRQLGSSPYFYSTAKQDSMIKKVVVHELGHQLADLPHDGHSNDSCVMYQGEWNSNTIPSTNLLTDPRFCPTCIPTLKRELKYNY